MILFLLIFNVFAQESFQVDVQSQTQVSVECPLADVIYTAVPATESAGRTLQVQAQLMDGSKARGNSWNFAMEKDPTGQKVTFRCEPPESALLKNSSQKYKVQIRGASIPLSVHIRYGSVNVTGLKSSSQFTVERGSIKLANTSQSVKLFVINGSIEVDQHNGRLKIETFDSKVKVTSVEGNVDINNFGGTTNLKSIAGEIVLDGKKSTFVVESSSGGLKFDTGAGKVELDSFNGPVDGQAEQTVVQAKLLNPVRFKLISKIAQAKVLVPSSSGAQVYFSLTDGQYQVPSFLKQDSSGSVKTVRGSLRGGESGRLNVTGETGRVQLSTY